MTKKYHTLLTPKEMADYGCQGHWPLGVADKVHFHELDALNHVNNVVYLSWFESIRVRYLQERGLSNYDGAKDAPRLLVKSVSADYVREMRFGEDYLVTARTKAFRQSSFTMEYAIWSGDLRTTGEAVVVVQEPDGSKKRPLSEALKMSFVEIDKAIPEA